MKTLLIWLWLSQGADVGTTAVALHRGCVERTYWTGNPAAIAGGKLAGSFVITLGAPKVRGGKALVLGFAAATTTAVVLNVHTMGGCR
jgi:hypothetical protein